jgi:hypothetical protein
VQGHPAFIRSLQEFGAEIAVHSFDHIDLNTCSLETAKGQLHKAADIFRKYDIAFHGFRCPYLSCSDELLDSLAEGLFAYSSNRAIGWDVIGNAKTDPLVFNTIRGFYQPQPAGEMVCVPWKRSRMVEIPVCVPDDLQLYDGLDFSLEQVVDFWSEILFQTHRRGELFTLLFHPELAGIFEQVFIHILQKAKNLQPAVWLARLQDICDWWIEKSSFRADVEYVRDGILISFCCSSRAAILARGIALPGSSQDWDGNYSLIREPYLYLRAAPLPFIGLHAGAQPQVRAFLEEQGYILAPSEQSTSCSVYLDEKTLANLPSQVALIDYIESCPGPLVRFWRWPNGARSVLSISGDLDALSLLDYASRLFIH